jgi:hypothetical protein
MSLATKSFHMHAPVSSQWEHGHGIPPSDLHVMDGYRIRFPLCVSSQYEIHTTLHGLVNNGEEIFG